MFKNEHGWSYPFKINEYLEWILSFSFTEHTEYEYAFIILFLMFKATPVFVLILYSLHPIFFLNVSVNIFSKKN